MVRNRFEGKRYARIVPVEDWLLLLEASYWRQLEEEIKQAKSLDGLTPVCKDECVDHHKPIGGADDHHE